MSEALLQELLDAGTPPMLVVRVGAEMARLAAEAAALDRRRTADKERQQAKRDAEKVDRHVTSRDIADVADETDFPPLDKKTPDPKKLIPTVHTRGDAPARGWPCPEGVDPQHWADFLTNRRRKKLAVTATAHNGQLRLLTELADDEWPPGRLVQLAAERGWGTIVDPYEATGTRNGQRPANDFRKPHRRADEIDDAARELGFGR